MGHIRFYWGIGHNPSFRNHRMGETNKENSKAVVHITQVAVLVLHSAMEINNCA